MYTHCIKCNCKYIFLFCSIHDVMFTNINMFTYYWRSCSYTVQVVAFVWLNIVHVYVYEIFTFTFIKFIHVQSNVHNSSLLLYCYCRFRVSHQEIGSFRCTYWSSWLCEWIHRYCISLFICSFKLKACGLRAGGRLTCVTLWTQWMIAWLSGTCICTCVYVKLPCFKYFM